MLNIETRERVINWLEINRNNGFFDEYMEEIIDFNSLDDEDIQFYYDEWILPNDRIDCKIGEQIVANIGLNRGWVEYSEGNNGEENYYRDVWINGVLAYCDGEICTIEKVDCDNQMIKLSNVEDRQFTIPYSQFKIDFM